jgi:hypothetical protein
LRLLNRRLFEALPVDEFRALSMINQHRQAVIPPTIPIDAEISVSSRLAVVKATGIAVETAAPVQADAPTMVESVIELPLRIETNLNHHHAAN